MRAPGEILVVNCYEQGRQPVAVAGALAELARAGFAPHALDVSVERIDDAALRQARLLAISVPMHTALRLGVRVAAIARAARPDVHVAFFGLYAELNAVHLLSRHGDSCFGAEAIGPLRELAEALERGSPPPGRARLPRAAEVRAAALVPLRTGLPGLDRYARLEHGGERRLVASVEATRGCKHLCRHCPVVPVYRGRFYALPAEAVLADAAQQIEAGAGHVSFADPDFLNGPRHALGIVRELHRRWPAVTFDATIKIEHLLQHRALLPELAACGCLFITSAVESLSDRVLSALAKGHTAADVPEALRLVRAAGIDLRPTLLPYTPWSALDDVRALFDFAEEHEAGIDPVQFTLRLLLPPGSPLAEGSPPWLGPFDAERFTWTWVHPDPRLDELQAASAATAAGAVEIGEPPEETFEKLRALARGEPRRPASPRRREVPRLTEPWFC